MLAYSIGIVFIIIIVLGGFGFGEGEEKDSLLEFTCEELQSGISKDGADGRFVTDWFTFNEWVGKEIKREAEMVKGCIQEEDGFDKYHYKNQ